MSSYHHRFPSPLGDVLVTVDEAGALTRLSLPDHDQRSAPPAHDSRPDAARCAHVGRALEAYFGGDAQALDALELAPQGTPFQLDVWRALRRVRAGTTTTYKQLAAAAGHPRAIRAVGAANGANRIALALPCHRVIGSDGKLTGFAFGLERKRALLELEGALPAQA